MQILNRTEYDPALINKKMSFKDWSKEDLSQILDEDWLDAPYILGASFEACECGCTDIPAIFKGVFIRCNMNNQELHAECSVADGDGLPGCNVHYKKANNGMNYLVEADTGYTVFVGCKDHKKLEERGLDTSIDAIPETEYLEKLTVTFDREAERARRNGDPYFMAQGVQYENQGYSILNDRRVA